FGTRDVMVVFSVSGTSTVAVEMAQGARRRGLRTVAVTSLPHTTATRTADRPVLADVADLVIDLGTPVGDALVAVPGLDTQVGPGSTVAAVTVVNEIKVQTAALLVQRGIVPPVLTAAAVIGEQRSTELFDAAYDEHARRVASALGGAGAARAEARRTAPSTRPAPTEPPPVQHPRTGYRLPGRYNRRRATPGRLRRNMHGADHGPPGRAYLAACHGTRRLARLRVVTHAPETHPGIASAAAPPCRNRFRRLLTTLQLVIRFLCTDRLWSLPIQVVKQRSGTDRGRGTTDLVGRA